MHLQEGRNLYYSSNIKQALFAFDRALDLASEEAAYWAYLGEYGYYLARRVTEEPLKTECLKLSTAAYEKARELEPYMAYRYSSLADVYVYWAKGGAADKWLTALSLYDRASQLSPRDTIVLNKWALALIVKGELDEARAKLELAESIDPTWFGNDLVSGLLSAEEGRSEEAGQAIVNSMQMNPSDFVRYFNRLFSDLAAYDMVRPLYGALDAYTKQVPGEWVPHAVFGITSLFDGELKNSFTELYAAMLVVPNKDAGTVFAIIGKLSELSPDFKAQLPSVASEWRAKLPQSAERDMLLRFLDQLENTPTTE
jgi:tetratricopeptide (TPR) repeat protein